MRQILAALLATSAIACQSAPQPDAEGNAGTTPTERRDTTSVTGGGQQPAGGATVTLDRTSYAPGGTVVMRLINQTSDTLGYNPCSNRAVERQQGEAWVQHEEPNRMCTMELRLLLPAESQNATTDLPGNLTSGSHRIVVSLSRQRTPPPGAPTNWGTVRAVSPTFRVQ